MHNILRLSCAVALVSLITGCSNFRKLGADLNFYNTTSALTCFLEDRSQFEGEVYGVVVEWDERRNKVYSADFCTVGDVGLFGFGVRNSSNQYLLAFHDRNGNAKYEVGEAAWIHSDEDGKPMPVNFDKGIDNRARLSGSLSTSTEIPLELIAAAREFRGARTAAEAATGWNIPIALGDIADLDDPKFASQLGEEGLWQPVSFPMKRSIGVYFLEEYDPNRTPVLFVYGAAGSPQDWRAIFSNLDSSKYQAWFYFYPTGASLDEAGGALNRAAELLHNHYQFDRLHVVAHSMGGLVSRSFLIKNVIEDNQTYINKFVSISTPWNGHEAAAMGVKYAPEVVPSWYDMQTDSDFQKQIFSKKIKGKVDHLLIYGTHASKSRILPPENDGTVSIASVTYEKAIEDSVQTLSFDEDHVSILSNSEVLAEIHRFLASP